MISHHKKRDNGDGPDRCEGVHPHAQVPQEPQTQPMVTPEADDVSHEDFSDMNPASPSTEPPPSAEQRGPSRRDERSRSRWANTSTFIFAGRRWRFSNRGSTKSREQPFKVTTRTRRLTETGSQKQRGKKTVAEKQSSDLPSAKKHNSIWFRWRRRRTSKRTWNFFKFSTCCTSTSS